MLTKIEKIASDSASKNESNFSSVNSLLNTMISRVSDSMKLSNSETKARTTSVLVELKNIQKSFAQLDSLINKMNGFTEKLGNSESTEKTLKQSEKVILEEIRRVKNMLVNTLSMIDRTPQNQDVADAIRTFGVPRG